MLRLLLKPFRQASHRRNGILSDQERQELPNQTFLSLVEQTLREGHTAEIWVKGYSMRPFIEYGRDKVRLKREETYGVGDAVLAQIAPGQYVLHRIIAKEGPQITLQGDGNIKGVETCREEDIGGKVIHYIRPLRTISAHDRTLRRRIRLWRKLRPVRPFLLWIYRATL